MDYMYKIFNFLFILLILTILLVSGCVQEPPTSTDKTPSESTYENGYTTPDVDTSIDEMDTSSKGGLGSGFLSNLKQVPEDYCIKYEVQIGGVDLSTEAEFCKSGKDKILLRDVYGSPLNKYCLDNEKIELLCTDSCTPTQGSCNQIADPYEINLNIQFGENTWKSEGDRQLAGVTAKCFSVEQGIEFCYHPQYKQALYLKDPSLTIEVKSFLTEGVSNRVASLRKDV